MSSAGASPVLLGNPPGVSDSTSVRSVRGFSLLETAIVVAVLCILAGIAAARFGDLRRRSAILATYSSLSSLDKAAAMYQSDYGALPPDRSPGVFPTEFAKYIDRKTFQKAPGVGGQWDWNGRNATPWTTHGPNMAVWLNPRVPGLWEQFDRMCDNNNLSSGALRLLNGNRNYCMMME